MGAQTLPYDGRSRRGRETKPTTFETLTPDAQHQYVERVRRVMRDKYRLFDKFALISSLLCPENADEDVRRFKLVKKYRDILSHGQDLNEGNLPVVAVQELGRRYLRLHFPGRDILA
jgi:hypothetical protein